MDCDRFHSIMILHGGRWDVTGRPKDFHGDGIMYDANTKYKGLVNSIATQLKINSTSIQIEIKYIISDRCPPIMIHNNTGVMVYLDQKKNVVDFFVKYPLYITMIDMSMDMIEQNEDSIVCVGRKRCNEQIVERQNLYTTDSVRLIGLTPGDEVFDEESVEIIGDATNSKIVVKQLYKDKETLAKVMNLHAFVNQFSFRTERSSATSYYLVCVVEDCTWFLRSSSSEKSNVFKIRKYCEIHTCSVRDQVYARRQGITKVVAGLVLSNLVDTNRVYTPNDIAADMLRQYGVKLNYNQAWRAKDKAVKMLRGDPTESYQKIPGYLYILEKHYPGSVISWKKTEENRFLYAFVSLDASIRGWEYCRPIVVVDGAALKSLYGGTILIASTLDPGGHILPLAYSVVDSENIASWTWFFEKFREAFGERNGMCIVSDRNDSIWKATSTVYPNISHHACIWHLWCNVKKNFRKNIEELQKLFFAMAKAYTLQQFEELMGRVDEIDMRVRGYLFEIGYHKWARVHSTVKRTWTLTSNIAESINNTNRIARRLPVVSVMDFMRLTVESWNAKQNEEATNTLTDLTDKYNKILKNNRALSHKMTVRASNEFLHTVTNGAKRFIVCLRNRRCSCGQFQLDEIPCSHAMAAITYRNQHGEDYCSPYYSNKNFKDAYAIPVEPLPCESTWKIPHEVLDEIVLPPDSKRPPGRPCTERWKAPNEEKCKRAKVTCSSCHREGHNKKTCHKHAHQV